VALASTGDGYRWPVPGFEFPDDVKFNREAISEPAAAARDAQAASWVFLCGEEFAAMDWGISYEEVRAAVPESVNIVADPPVDLDMDVAREVIDALDRLPRPTLMTCRTGPRASALAYLYAGLRSNATAADVLACAEADDAPFARVEAYRAFVTQGLQELATD
jgi:hypothetical protein